MYRLSTKVGTRRDGSLLLRPPARRLLPICHGMAGFLGVAPALARGSKRRFGVAIEEVEATAVFGEARRGGTIGKHRHVGPVGVLVAVGQPDRLALGTPVALAAMGQEAGVVISPQGGVETSDALG